MARLSCRSPERLSRWRTVLPEEAGIGAVPASIANAPSSRQRPACDQAASTVAATIGPTPVSGRAGPGARTTTIGLDRLLVRGGFGPRGPGSRRAMALSVAVAVATSTPRRVRGAAAAARWRCMASGRLAAEPGPDLLGGGDDQRVQLAAGPSVAASTAARRAVSSTCSAARSGPVARLRRDGCGPTRRGRRGRRRSGRTSRPAAGRAGGTVELARPAHRPRPGAACQPGAVAAGALHRPRPQPRRGRRRARSARRSPSGSAVTVLLGQHRAGRRATTAAVWVCLWVSTPMTTSTCSASMGICVLLRPGTDVGSGPVGDRQDCDGTRQRLLAVKLLIRPAAPGRAGVEDSGRTSPSKGTAGRPGSESRPPPRPPAHHIQPRANRRA